MRQPLSDRFTRYGRPPFGYQCRSSGPTGREQCNARRWAVRPTWRARRLPGPPPQPAPGWVVRPEPGRRDRTVVHDAPCRHNCGSGTELGAQEAVDALTRQGARACAECDAAAVLVSALELGQGHG
ncbi:DUF6233 domain-containing protein [Streptomyces sp. NPDC002125]